MAVENGTESQWVKDLTTRRAIEDIASPVLSSVSWTGTTSLAVQNPIAYTFQKSKYTPENGQPASVQNLNITQI